MGRPAHLAFTGLNADRSVSHDERPPFVAERWPFGLAVAVWLGAKDHDALRPKDERKEPL